jgi:puromycin-sensitive aminopeptidase
MAIDALKNTRSIENTVLSPEDCRSMFDILTYEKGASVLRMLEQYLGAERFRKGIASYLKKHEYANAETSDLWDALETASGEPVRNMMDTWIFQQGFPIVSAELTADGRGLKLSQRRFFYAPPANPEPQLWHIPVMVRAGTDQGIKTHKVLLTGEEATLDLGGKVTWATINENGNGFFRGRYAPELLQGLTRNLKELKPIERFGVVSDTWAATVAGLTPLGEFLKMAPLLRDEEDINVWRALIGAFNYLEMLATDSQLHAIGAAVRKTLGPAFARLGWEPAAGEDELRGQMRAMFAGTLGTIGEDQRVRQRAADLYELWHREPARANRDLLPAFVSILAYTGDEVRYGEFKRTFKSARTPQEEQRYLFALANFQKIELLRQTMQMTLSGEVRTQNAPFLMHSLLYNRVSRLEAWDFIKANWETMVNRFPDSALPRMCEAIVGLADKQPEVEEFFAQHKIRLGGKLIDQHLERLAVAVEFRKRESGQLVESLAI